MQKMYSMISVMLLAAVSLCAQAPNGYMEKGPLNEDFSRFEKVVVEEDWESGETISTTVFEIPFGWVLQKGTPAKSYDLGASEAIQGKYLRCSANFLQTDQTIPTLLITPMLKGNVTFYIRPYSISSYYITNYLEKNKSWVKIYGGSLNAEGGIDWNLETPLFTKVFTAVPEGADANGWVQCNFSTTAYQFLGIQMSYACFDELTAENHCMLIKKVIKPTKVTSEWTDSNPLYGDAEGKATWTGQITIKNEGDEAISANVEKLIVESTSKNVTTTMTEFIIPEAIAVGEEKTFNLSVPVQAANPLADARSAIKLISKINNVDNKDISVQSAWFTIKTMAPKLVVKNTKKDDVTSYETALGLQTAPASTKFTLNSTGGSSVMLKSITSTTMSNLSFQMDGADVVYPLEISKGESKEITMTFGNTGGNSGTLIFTYGNSYDETVYTVESKTISVIVADPSLYLEEFAATLPQGWVNEAGSNWSCKTAGGTPANSYMDNGNTNMYGKYLISPKLHFSEGQKLTIMAQGKNASSCLRVLTSTDRATWTQAAEKKTWAKTAYTFDASKCELLIVDMPVGDCYIAFEAGYACIDYIMGGTKVDVTDDIYTTISGAEKGMVNYQYELAVELTNLTATAYEDKAVVLELKNGDDVVATNMLPAIAGEASGIKDTLRFTPHVAEEATLTLNVKKGDVVLAALTKAITIAEETVNSVVTTGEQLSTGSTTPLKTNYYNSMSEFIYTADKIGLAMGIQLTSLTFNYYNTNKDITGNVKIWLQNTEDGLVGTTFTDVKTMTNVFSEDNHLFKKEGFSSACVDKTFIFSTLFVYTGGNLRVVICSEDKDKQGGYTNTGWGYEKVENSVIYKYADNYDSYLNNAPSKSGELPIAKIGFAKEVPTISGEVILANGDKAGAGRKIEAKSGNVIYTTTTTAEGTYSIAIMQDALTYDLYLDGVKVHEGVVLNETTLVDNTVVVNITEQSTGTGCQQVAGYPNTVRKVLIDGHLYIERGDKMYDINGQRVK